MDGSIKCRNVFSCDGSSGVGLLVSIGMVVCASACLATAATVTLAYIGVLQ